MIHEILIDQDSEEGYAYKLELFKELGDSIKPPEGVSVLFGPNGCGKSTLLTMMGIYTTSIPIGQYPIGYDYMSMRGWNTMPGLSKNIEDFDHSKKIYLPNSAGEIDLDWDGGLTYYKDFTRFIPSMPHDPELYKGSAIKHLLKAGSRGESTLSHMENLKEELEKAPKIDEIEPDPRWNELWKDHLNNWKDYVLSRGSSEGYTFLLDEPDAHLSIPRQDETWEWLINFSSENNVQIITASQSPVVLFRPEIYIIDFKKGYAEECRDVLKRHVK